MQPEIENVVLDGKSYAIPLLPTKVIKKVMPRYFKIRGLSGEQLLSGDLTEDQWQVMQEIIVLGVNFVDKDFTYQIIEEMHLTLSDMMLAVVSIVRQCGARKREGEQPAGEASPAL